MNTAALLHCAARLRHTHSFEMKRGLILTYLLFSPFRVPPIIIGGCRNRAELISGLCHTRCGRLFRFESRFLIP